MKTTAAIMATCKRSLQVAVSLIILTGCAATVRNYRIDGTIERESKIPYGNTLRPDGTFGPDPLVIDATHDVALKAGERALEYAIDRAARAHEATAK